MTQRQLVAVLAAVVSVPAAAQRGPYALVLAEAPRAASLPVTVGADFRPVAEALGLTEPIDPARIRVFWEHPDGAVALPAQFTPAEGYDPTASPVGSLSVVLPADAIGRLKLRVYFAGEPAQPPPSPPGALRVQERDGVVTVENDYFRVTHDPSVMAGLPSRIEFKDTGKVFTGYGVNDRVHHADLGSFRLSSDTDPSIEVGARGPVRAVVRVSAAYTQGDTRPDSRPRAVYEFSYFAGSPLIHATAHVEQDAGFPWQELHFVEINFPDETFPNWAADDPGELTPFAADAESHMGQQWGAFVQGDSVLGLLGCGTVRIYDGRGGYGTYLHGPWVSWGTTERRFSGYLFASGRPGALAVLNTAAEGIEALRPAVVTVPAFVAQLEELRATVARMPKGPLRGAYSWALSLAERLGHGEGRLLAAIAALADIAHDLEGNAPDPHKRLDAWAEGTSVSLMRSAEVGVGFAHGPGQGVRLASFYDFRAERELLPLSGSAPLFAVELSGPDGASASVGAHGQWRRQAVQQRRTPNGARGALIWARPAEQGLPELSARCDFELSGARLSMRLKIDNPSDRWSIRRVDFPRASCGQIGRSADDDFVVTPRASGELRRAPLLRGYSFRGTYPSGWVTMQFMGYYDRDCGLYLATHDPLGSTKDLHADRTSDGDAVDLRINWPNADMGVPGSDFEHPGLAVLASFHGDWFDAAQMYKSWARRQAQWWPHTTASGRPDTPGWLKKVAIWALSSGEPKKVVGPVRDFAKFMGVPTALHWYSWHQIPFDDDYPHYFPTKEGFADGVRELQAAGVRVMPYINGRLWDTDLEDFASTGIKGATKNEQGDYYTEQYGSGQKLAPMCPTTALWQDTVQGIVLRLVGDEVGVDGVYIDQVAAASPRLCFDASHGHPLGGGHWWTVDGYWPMLRSLRKRLPPGKMITTECNAESYAKLFDGYLTWHFQYQDQIPLFAAVYGGQLQLFSRAYRGNDGLAHRMKAAQSLVFGEQIGWISPGIISDEVNGPFLRRMARLRHALLPYLSWGEMARPPKVAGDIPDVTADWAWRGEWPITDTALQRGAWKSRDGRLALIFVNVTDQPLGATLRFDGEDYGLGPAKTLTITPRDEGGPRQPFERPSDFEMPIDLPPYGAIAYEIN
ncbi:MAG: DUF6259 domain-containing protein [Armatimonadota bacterium]